MIAGVVSTTVPPPPPPGKPGPLTAAPGPDRAPTDETEDPYIGSLLNGQYRVESRLGVGGMGAVYLAEEVGMRRKVAVKVLMRRPGDTGERERRFRREAQAASRLLHPNIVTVHNFGRLKDGTLFIAMEHIEGESLADLLNREAPLELARALDVTIQVADAVSEAHSKGIVHRDLKPDNILLTLRRGAEIAKILDFGIAKVVDPNEDSVQTTRVGLVRGTPRYMSPEQARGEAVDHRTDIYSLGVLLYLAISGEIPIRADTPFGYLHAHQHQIPEPLGKVRPDIAVRPPLENLVMRCLAKQPEERPQTLEEVVGALRLEHALLTGATPDPAWGSIAPLPPQRGRLALPAAAGAVLLTLVGLSVWWFWPTDGPRGQAGLRQAAAVGQVPEPPTKVRKLEASALERPRWLSRSEEAGEGPVKLVGRSGPAPTLDDARRQAEHDATERLLRHVLRRLPAADLRLVLQGWMGNRREVLAGQVTYADRSLLDEGPSEASKGPFRELAHGQTQVAAGLQAVTGKRAGGLDQDDLYWEHYGYGPPTSPKDFWLAWLDLSLSAEDLGRLERRFSTDVQIAGIVAVEPLPLIAWRLGDVRGALVRRIADGSPAARAGLRPADLIQQVADKRTRSLTDFETVFRPIQAKARRSGGGVTVRVRRAGEGEVEVKLAFPRPRQTVRPSTGGGSIDE